MAYNLPILVYHKVDTRRELGITSVSPQRFERQIKFLEHEGYASILSQSFGSDVAGWLPQAHDFGNTEHNGTSRPVKPALITFDDGYEGIYTHAYPILKEYASTAIIFVTTGYIGKNNNWDTSPGPRFKHLDWAHIREMADNGIWFGSHGTNHTFLTRQSDSAARHEIEASKKALEDALGRPIRFFSYPYGDYDDRIINLVREVGYEAAFSLRPELLRTRCVDGRILAVDHEYALPRIAIYLVDHMWAFKAKIGCVRGGLLPYMQKLKNRLINRCAYASTLLEHRDRGTIRSRIK